jgi:antitoxin HigA-1
MLPRNRPPTPPGEILQEEFLTPKHMTQVELASRMKVSLQRVNELIRGKRGVTAETAILLGEVARQAAAASRGLVRLLGGPPELRGIKGARYLGLGTMAAGWPPCATTMPTSQYATHQTGSCAMAKNTASRLVASLSSYSSSIFWSARARSPAYCRSSAFTCGFKRRRLFVTAATRLESGSVRR